MYQVSYLPLALKQGGFKGGKPTRKTPKTEFCNSLHIEDVRCSTILEISNGQRPPPSYIKLILPNIELT